ncbi:hypothetical protein P8452_71165 [Trifolium repens]|nr:hypothetical protein P8452_71165 [Trifolium repens]
MAEGWNDTTIGKGNYCGCNYKYDYYVLQIYSSSSLIHQRKLEDAFCKGEEKKYERQKIVTVEQGCESCGGGGGGGGSDSGNGG